MDTFSKSDPGTSLDSLLLSTISIQTFSSCCSLKYPPHHTFHYPGTAQQFNFLTSDMKSPTDVCYQYVASISEHKHRGRSRRQYSSWGGDKLCPRSLPVASQLGLVISRDYWWVRLGADTQRENIIKFPKADQTELFEVNWTWTKLHLHFLPYCLLNN